MLVSSHVTFVDVKVHFHGTQTGVDAIPFEVPSKMSSFAKVGV